MITATTIAIFPPSAAMMNNVQFCFFDNNVHEPAYLEGVVAVIGLGEGYLDAICEATQIGIRPRELGLPNQIIDSRERALVTTCDCLFLSVVCLSLLQEGYI